MSVKMFNEVWSLLVDLLFPGSFEIVPNDDASINENKLDVDQLPEFILISFFMNSEYLSCICEIEEFTLMMWSFNT